MSLLIIKSFKINKNLIIIITIIITLFTSIILFYSFANDTQETNNTNFIKWVDFNITSEALNLTAKLDIDSHNNNNNGIIYNWIELLAYLACKNGGDFKSFKKSDLDTLVNKLSNVETISDLTNNLKFYDYYYESYSAVLSNFIGNYEIETENEEIGRAHV